MSDLIKKLDEWEESAKENEKWMSAQYLGHTKRESLASRQILCIQAIRKSVEALEVIGDKRRDILCEDERLACGIGATERDQFVELCREALKEINEIMGVKE